ncbi:helix-turn-helix domain-containing protein [Haloferula sp. A504]|uniref:helix-turn-helix domain-containing protein n=1 Tax=Haloferula sp. A504 TaxID=3373601 RepID=UPI0031C83BD0|nr:helix-turn-helix domain-containing protein [Verrucomicrobiaceae bacterium E54]
MIPLGASDPMNNQSIETRLVDAARMAAILSVSPRTVLYWAERDEIPVAIRKGRVIRFDPEEVFEALRNTPLNREEGQ